MCPALPDRPQQQQQKLNKQAARQTAQTVFTDDLSKSNDSRVPTGAQNTAGSSCKPVDSILDRQCLLGSRALLRLFAANPVHSANAKPAAVKQAVNTLYQHTANNLCANNARGKAAISKLVL